MSLASLTATLTHYLLNEAESEIPVWQMISAAEHEVRARAEQWRSSISAIGVDAAVVPARSAIGGGSLPGETLPSWALSLSPNGSGQSPEMLLANLRGQATPVIARIEDDTIRLDPRTVLPDQDGQLVEALIATVSG